MTPLLDAALVDFGEGRRLERFGGLLVDRPHPAARGPRRLADAWGEAAAIYSDDPRDPRAGSWRFAGELPSPWLATVPLDGNEPARQIHLHVRPAPSGQLGIFLEQAPLWRRLFARCRPGDRVLSLFAHTGAATLAMAAAGAEVFHVDASRQAIRTARDNAATSDLSAAPIHWIEEDAVRYCRRVARRGERFDALVLDPPSWGHGPRGEAFSIERDLAPLLAAAAAILSEPAFVVLTCHTSGWDESRLVAAIQAVRPGMGGLTNETGRLFCEDPSGRRLDLGRFATGGLR
jgi:23S rRNA (cytosine1962-C5)-methyltransferase